MRRLALVVLMAIFAVFLAVGFGVPDDELRGRRYTANADDETRITDAVGNLGVRGPGQPTQPPPQTAPPRSPVDTAATLRGRCVTGAVPQAGVRVRLREAEATKQGGTRIRASVWAGVEQVTGADGRFELRFASRGTTRLYLTMQSDRHASMGGFVEPLGPDAERELGNIDLTHGTLINGSVFDQAGSVVAAEHVYFEVGTSHRSGRFATKRSVTALTTTDGHFVARDRLPAGGWRASVSGRQLVDCAQHEVAPNTPHVHVPLVVTTLAPTDTITGRVVDPSGRALAKVQVFAPGVRGRTTLADGSFELRRHASNSGLVALQVKDRKLQNEQREWKWGSADVTLVARQPRSASLRVSVTDGATGAPVETFSAFCIPADSAAFRPSGLGQNTWPGGHYEIEALREGRYVLTILPPDGFVSEEPIAFDHDANGPTILSTRLHRPAELRVHVAYADGTPVAESVVDFVAPLTGPNARAIDATIPVTTVRQFQFRVPGRNYAFAWARERTDAEGLAVLKLPPSRGVLRVIGKTHQPHIHEPMQLAGAPRTLRITVRER